MAIIGKDPTGGQGHHIWGPDPQQSNKLRLLRLTNFVCYDKRTTGLKGLSAAGLTRQWAWRIYIYIYMCMYIYIYIYIYIYLFI
jgi:hypothetical protein